MCPQATMCSNHVEPQVQQKIEAKTFSFYLELSTLILHPQPIKESHNDDQYGSSIVHNKTIYQER